MASGLPRLPDMGATIGGEIPSSIIKWAQEGPSFPARLGASTMVPLVQTLRKLTDELRKEVDELVDDAGWFGEDKTQADLVKRDFDRWEDRLQSYGRALANRSGDDFEDIRNQVVLPLLYGNFDHVIVEDRPGNGIPDISAPWRIARQGEVLVKLSEQDWQNLDRAFEESAANVAASIGEGAVNTGAAAVDAAVEAAEAVAEAPAKAAEAISTTFKVAVGAVAVFVIAAGTWAATRIAGANR